MDKKNNLNQEQQNDDAATRSIEELEEELKECMVKKAEYLDGWQRARAEFQNYKKEEAGRMEAVVQFGNELMILRLLPILDNFELARKAIPDDLSENSHIKGLMLIKNQIDEFIKENGVSEVAAINQMFNPIYHEVVQEVDKEGVSPGIVVEEVQKGYILNGKVIRPAKVKLAK